MITSKLTSKAQTTVPQSVRKVLNLREGDEIAYEIRDGEVVIQKAEKALTEDPFGAFVEWDSEADRKAYGRL